MTMSVPVIRLGDFMLTRPVAAIEHDNVRQCVRQPTDALEVPMGADRQ